MKTTRRPGRARCAPVALATAILVTACGGGSDVQGVNALPPRHTDEPLRAGVVVSAPYAVQSAVSASPAAWVASLASTVTYVSMRPGTVDSATSARVTDLRSGVSLTTPVHDGGFDPLAIPAVVGDTIGILVSGATGGIVQAYIEVKDNTPPVIVRSNPPDGQTDVPLNTNIVIVFSEPILAASVNTSTIVVRSAGALVSGSLQFVTGSVVSVLFVPDAPLSTSTQYTVTITAGVTDITGHPVGSATLNFQTVPAPPAPITLASISVGSATCGISPDGAAYCWGANASGQIGDGTTTDRHVAVPVAGGLTFASISSGNSHTCALTIEGIAYCWGSNTRGQLGDGSLASHYVPAAVAGGLQFSSISAVDLATCAVTPSGDAYCWGQNAGGMTGGGSGANCPADSCTIPVKVAGGLAFASVSVGAYSSCGLTRTGLAYCWGANGYGELGNGAADGPELCSPITGYALPGSFTDAVPCSPAPVPVSGGLTFASAIAGGFFACGLVADGTAYCWGANNTGEFGDGTATGFLPHSAPFTAAGSLRFRALSPGNQRICGIALTGDTYCWGFNSNGEAGRPPGCPNGSSCTYTPNLVPGGLKFQAVSVGGARACGLVASGAAYCWGNNFGGGLGNDSITQSSVPVQVLMRQ